MEGTPHKLTDATPSTASLIQDSPGQVHDGTQVEMYCANFVSRCSTIYIDIFGGAIILTLNVELRCLNVARRVALRCVALRCVALRDVARDDLCDHDA